MRMGHSVILNFVNLGMVLNYCMWHSSTGLWGKGNMWMTKVRTAPLLTATWSSCITFSEITHMRNRTLQITQSDLAASEAEWSRKNVETLSLYLEILASLWEQRADLEWRLLTGYTLKGRNTLGWTANGFDMGPGCLFLTERHRAVTGPY